MVLNLLRVEEVNPEYMMERSFKQFQNYTSIPKVNDLCRIKIVFVPQIFEDVKSLEARVSGMRISMEEEVTSYARLRDQLTGLGNNSICEEKKKIGFVS
jgi:ATP-dependent RNA helicase DOB1